MYYNHLNGINELKRRNTQMEKEVFNINDNTTERLEVGSLKIGKNVIIYNESFIVCFGAF